MASIFKRKNTDQLVLSTLLATILFFSCCSGNQSSKKKSKKATTFKSAKVFTIKTPAKSHVVRKGEEFIISIGSNANSLPDSVVLSYLNKPFPISQTGELEYTATANIDLVGNQTFKLLVFYSDSLSESHIIKLFVLPDTKPVNYTYKVIRSFQHDPMAYTQGLSYLNGYIYESTGQKKRSSIRKLNIETGEVINKKALEPQFFGEGIAIVGKEIFMLTYHSQVGFVFDAVTFDLIREFNLQTREGWGLTTDGEQLILSDGSAKLYFFEPLYFSLIKQIEVCDFNGLVSNINELELTPDGLFANIYGENYIVIIDKNTGTVIGKLDLSALFPEEVPRDYDHVMNGIAYNPERQTFYVTGKQWSVLYEINIMTD